MPNSQASRFGMDRASISKSYPEMREYEITRRDASRVRVFGLPSTRLAGCDMTALLMLFFDAGGELNFIEFVATGDVTACRVRLSRELRRQFGEPLHSMSMVDALAGLMKIPPEEAARYGADSGLDMVETAWSAKDVRITFTGSSKGLTLRFETEAEARRQDDWVGERLRKFSKEPREKAD
ncbi:MAG: hypothetical protein FWD68_05010 [Alphaproteobacteria bacterium]|nr:hypothetical protein [Alphaproteobacteria bacterium]